MGIRIIAKLVECGPTIMNTGKYCYRNHGKHIAHYYSNASTPTNYEGFLPPTLQRVSLHV